MLPKHSLRILISEQEIQACIKRLALEISEQYRDCPLTLLGVMTGSLFFLTDLMRQLTIPHQVGVIQASSYPGNATTPEKLRVNLDYLPDLTGRSVLLIDDILDTGQTLDFLKKEISSRCHNEIQTAVLLWKKSRTVKDVTPDYLGFEIEDEFVVGYGLDYADDYRHLSAIHVPDFSVKKLP
ncbi:MAG: hypoxanthine phosphoribosyltransferase [Planctomycetaceae bacterium]|nr:hypoxanthine phosphoribosyltransferase [Planctomycetaceae bacterium]